MVLGLRRGGPLAFLGVLAALVCVAPSSRGDVPSACASAFSSGPNRVKQGQLIEGRADLRRCAAAACPAAMSALCADDLRRLEPRVPSVVFAATDERGRDLTSVRVSEDGRVLADRIDGRALELDPGPHRFRFERDTGSAADLNIVVREGEKSRLVRATLASMASLATEAGATSRPIPWSVYLSGGLTIAAASAYASFGILGLVERGDLSSCKGSCNQDAVDTAWDHLRVADGFLIATLAGVAVTTVLLVTRPKVSNVAVGASVDGFRLSGRF